MANLQYATNLPLIRPAAAATPLPQGQCPARHQHSLLLQFQPEIPAPGRDLAGPQLPFAEPLGPEGHQGAVVGAGYRILVHSDPGAK